MKDGWRVLLAVAAVALFGGVRLAGDALDQRQHRLAQPDELYQRAYADAPDGSLELCAGADGADAPPVADDWSVTLDAGRHLP